MEQEIHQGEEDGAAIAVPQPTTLLHDSVADYMDIKTLSVRTLKARSSLELEDLLSKLVL